MSTDKPTPNHIAGMNPEQVLALRDKFETQWLGPDHTPGGYGYEDYRNYVFRLAEDGFSYANEEVHEGWGWFLAGAGQALKDITPKESDSMQSLMLMRCYSSCFTKAFDNKEPVFVLRAQDITSSKALAQWLHANKDLGESHPKFIAAKATLGQFENWPNRKKPD